MLPFFFLGTASPVLRAHLLFYLPPYTPSTASAAAPFPLPIGASTCKMLPTPPPRRRRRLPSRLCSAPSFGASSRRPRGHEQTASLPFPRMRRLPPRDTAISACWSSDILALAVSSHKQPSRVNGVPPLLTPASLIPAVRTAVTVARKNRGELELPQVSRQPNTHSISVSSLQKASSSVSAHRESGIALNLSAFSARGRKQILSTHQIYKWSLAKVQGVCFPRAMHQPHLQDSFS